MLSDDRAVHEPDIGIRRLAVRVMASVPSAPDPHRPWSATARRRPTVDVALVAGGGFQSGLRSGVQKQFTVAVFGSLASSASLHSGWPRRGDEAGHAPDAIGGDQRRERSGGRRRCCCRSASTRSNGTWPVLRACVPHHDLGDAVDAVAREGAVIVGRRRSPDRPTSRRRHRTPACPLAPSSPE